jgi:hypothetical protein
VKKISEKSTVKFLSKNQKILGILKINNKLKIIRTANFELLLVNSLRRHKNTHQILSAKIASKQLALQNLFTPDFQPRSSHMPLNSKTEFVCLLYFFFVEGRSHSDFERPFGLGLFGYQILSGEG